MAEPLRAVLQAHEDLLAIEKGLHAWLDQMIRGEIA